MNAGNVVLQEGERPAVSIGDQARRDARRFYIGFSAACLDEPRARAWVVYLERASENAPPRAVRIANDLGQSRTLSSDGLYAHVRWSPDGKMVAAGRYESDDRQFVVLFERDSGARAEIPLDRSFRMVEFSFSPDSRIALLGATVGNTVVLLPLSILDSFGLAEYPTLYARANLFTTFGVATGPLLLGAMHAALGGYRWPMVVLACGSAAAAVLLALLPRVRRERLAS